MLLYNLTAAAVLFYAGLVLQLTAIGLWPTLLVHMALALCCVVCLRSTTLQARQ